MAKRKQSELPKNDFAPEEDNDIISFTSEPIITGECISSFFFDDDPISENNILEDNRKVHTVNGMAPPVDGEFLDVKRTYMLRSSTVRKLNELKSIHPDLNTYVSTLVDLAIAHYYEHIVNEGGTQ